MSNRRGPRKGPVLPRAPQGVDPQITAAHNELVRILGHFFQTVHFGISGDQYTVSGNVTTSITVDLGSVTLTATTQALARLLLDLKKSGIIMMREVSA